MGPSQALCAPDPSRVKQPALPQNSRRKDFQRLRQNSEDPQLLVVSDIGPRSVLLSCAPGLGAPFSDLNQRRIPARLKEAGHQFELPDLVAALGLAGWSRQEITPLIGLPMSRRMRDRGQGLAQLSPKANQSVSECNCATATYFTRTVYSELEQAPGGAETLPEKNQ